MKRRQSMGIGTYADGVGKLNIMYNNGFSLCNCSLSSELLKDVDV